MPECQNCGSHVTEQWCKVAGDNDDVALSCPHCPDEKKIGSAGNAAGNEVNSTYGIWRSQEKQG